MPQRQAILRMVADAILRLPANPIVRVGVDGVDGAGKTVFGDQLAQILASDRAIIRASVDAFHHPRALRYRRGRDSPDGYFHDSYNYARLREVLLDPLSPGGSGRYRIAAFDYRTDQPVASPEAQAGPGAILIFDGIFLHRPELRSYWDFSILLEVGFDISIPRGARRHIARSAGAREPPVCRGAAALLQHMRAQPPRHGGDQQRGARIAIHREGELELFRNCLKRGV